MQRADQGLVASAVAQGPPHGAEPRAERRLRHDAPVPDRVDQLVLADDPVAVAHQVDEQSNTCGSISGCGFPAPQLVPGKINLEIGEAEIRVFPVSLMAGMGPPVAVRLSRRAACRFIANPKKSRNSQRIFQGISAGAEGSVLKPPAARGLDKVPRALPHFTSPAHNRRKIGAAANRKDQQWLSSPPSS